MMSAPTDPSVDSDAAPPGHPYVSFARKVEALFALHGDTHQGLGYPKPDHFKDRYRVYLDVIRFGPPAPRPIKVLDIGCATAGVLEEIKAASHEGIRYIGLDLSHAMIEAAKQKHPEAAFLVGDPFDCAEAWSPAPDYVIMGGIFTWRPGVSTAEMTEYMIRLLHLSFERCRRGVAFNVMSHHVDWQRDDLFHVPFDTMAEIVQSKLSRNYIFRADYGLYEYTTYVYK